MANHQVSYCASLELQLLRISCGSQVYCDWSYIWLVYQSICRKDVFGLWNTDSDLFQVSLILRSTAFQYNDRPQSFLEMGPSRWACHANVSLHLHAEELERR